MLFGHKSPIKNHLSPKHPTHTHHVVVKAAPEHGAQSDERMEMTEDHNPEMQTERPEVTPIRS